MAEQAELTRPEAGRKVETINPATGQPGRSYPAASLDDARAAAAAAHQAFLKWRRTSFAERSAIIHEAAAILRTRKDEFARLMTEEMGKTVTDGLAEVEKCAFHCDWFADNAAKYLANEPVDFDGEEAFVYLQSDRHRARRDALELPVLAGFSFRRAGADGWQRSAFEACEQRAGLRPRD